jgi:hypothetical protein
VGEDGEGGQQRGEMAPAIHMYDHMNKNNKNRGWNGYTKLDWVEFMAKNIAKDKEGHFLMTEGLIH